MSNKRPAGGYDLSTFLSSAHTKQKTMAENASASNNSQSNSAKRSTCYLNVSQARMLSNVDACLQRFPFHRAWEIYVLCS